MDESWRMQMGMEASFPAVARKSMEEYSTLSRRASGIMEAEDFADVFGGPPRSVLAPKFSGDFTLSKSFYDEVFLAPEFASRAPPQFSKAQGRNLPAFRIPPRGDGFYSELFVSADEWGGRRSRTTSKSKSKSNSSSLLSSEAVSPLAPTAAASVDDVALSFFASKLRPINVPSRCKTGQWQRRKQGTTPFVYENMDVFHYYSDCNYSYGNNNDYGVGSRRAFSPETISMEPNSYTSMNMGPSSPASSPVSSVCQERSMMEEDIEQEEDDEVMSCYVIEINSDYRNSHRDGGNDAINVDEAIAWAKERFRKNDDKEKTHETEGDQVGKVSIQGSVGHGTIKSLSMEGGKNDWKADEEEEKSEEQLEVELLDEDIRLWHTGKETNIRLLLSTLHLILWPNSGWSAISLATFKEGSQLKKAYQRAKLCLHPDELQQRGATLSQKYVAQKAFSVLQDAWAAYISQEGFLN